jgi:hypothetical protein
MKRLQNAPENGSSNETTPSSKLGNSAGIALRDGTSRSLVEVPSTNVGELALLGEESGVGSNLNMSISKGSYNRRLFAGLTLETDERKAPK